MRYDPDKLSDAMKLYRVAAVADELGVGRDHLYKLMRGERPLSDHLAERLAQVLGISVEELHADEREPTYS